MERSINGEMADKQNPLDYGVQIRFIDNLKESKKPQKNRSKSPKANSYGVAVRVQGIDGQPFVVLNSGEKRESSYGVQIRTDNTYRDPTPTNPPVPNLPLDSNDRFSKTSKATGSISSDSDLPENPYAVKSASQPRSQGGSQYSSTSDEEQGSKYYTKAQKTRNFQPSTQSRPSSRDHKSSSPQTVQKFPSSKISSGDELRRSRSQGSLLSPDVEDHYEEKHYSERSATVSAIKPTPAGERVGSNSSTLELNREQRNNLSGLRPMGKQQSVSSETPRPLQTKAKPSLPLQAGPTNLESIDIDTKPLSSVDSLINKFDVKGQSRGRPAGRRSRIPLDERKRSQSLDRVPHRDTSDFRELQEREVQVKLRDDSRLQNGTQSRTATAYNSNSLNRPHRGDSQDSEVNRSVLTREWLNQSVEEPVIERQQQKKVQAELQLKSTPDLLRDQQPGSSEHTKELIYSILRDGTTESESSLQRKTSLVFEKIQAFTQASSPDGTQSLMSQKNELQRKVGELQRQLEEETKQRMKVEVSRERPRASMQNLEIQLEETTEERNRLKELFERKKTELHGTSQELLEVRMEKEQVESKMRDLEDRLLDMQEEAARIRASSGGSSEKDALLKELMETREELEEVLVLRQKQDELLRQRERELTALKGALKEEVANHDKEMDRVRQQYQKDMEQLRKNMEDVSQDQQSLESERQKINSVMRSLQREVDESSEEITHWKDMFQKNKDELRSTKQELMQAKLEKEEFEDELREVKERYSVMQVEVDHFKSGAVGAEEVDAVKRNLQQMQEQLRHLSLETQRQEELLHQRERELGALKGALKDEVASHDQDVEQLKQQFQKDMKQLRRDFEETSMDKAAIESERKTADQMRKVIESTLKETQEENDDLRRRVLGLEAQLKEFKVYCDELQESEQRLKEKIGKLEAERKEMEETLGEATDQEQELVIVKRALEGRLEESQRNLKKLSQDYQELRETYQEEMKQKDQLKRMKGELEEQKRLLDKTIEKLNKELDQMADDSRSSLSGLQAQLEEYKEKSRKEITESQKQVKERTAEAERIQFNISKLQEEIQRLKQALQESQAEKETAELDKELLTQRLQSVTQDMESKKRSQDDRLRQAKGLEDKVKRLEAELDEEKNTVELLTDRINRSRDQVVGRPGLPYDNELLGTNTFVRSLQLYAQSYNMSECWVCGANVVSEAAGYPWIGIPWTERHLRDPQQPLQWETVTQTKPWRKHRLHLAVPARDGAFCITQPGTLTVGNSSCTAANITVRPGLSSWGSYELRQLNLTATLINRWVFGTINTENCPNLALPRGIYWLCGPWAYRWLPCGWGGDCYLGFVIPAIHHRNVLPQGRLRNKRSFVGKPEGAAGIAFAPFGVYWAFIQIDRLATLLDELMNETTDAIARLNTEQQQARLVVLQNRMSLDYLLAAKGGVCALVGSECCSYIEDQSGKVVQDLEQLEEIQSKLRTPEEGSWFSWLGAWEKGLLHVVVLCVGGLLIGCCCFQCCLTCVPSMLGRLRSAQVRVVSVSWDINRWVVLRGFSSDAP